MLLRTGGDDCIKKYAKHFISWCVENRIDTVVMGVNHLWKQGAYNGHWNNQKGYHPVPLWVEWDPVRGAGGKLYIEGKFAGHGCHPCIWG